LPEKEAGVAAQRGRELFFRVRKSRLRRVVFFDEFQIIFVLVVDFRFEPSAKRTSLP
jgi:hypothetical protein